MLIDTMDESGGRIEKLLRGRNVDFRNYKVLVL